MSPATALNNVVVIPLNSAKKLKNVITVSLSNGDFTDPATAVASIVDASDTNPYLVLIGPGIYTLTTPLTLKPYVVVVGSGVKNTTLTGAISTNVDDATSAMVIGASYSAISDLKILNSGGSHFSIGIYNDGASYDISRVTIEAWGGSMGTYGIFNINYSSPTITDTLAYGGQSPVTSYGVYNNSSSPILTHVTLDAWVDEIQGGNASAIGNFVSSHPHVRYSTLEGSTQSIKQGDGNTIHVSYSTLIRGVASIGGGSGTLTCVHNDNGNGAALNSNCISP